MKEQLAKLIEMYASARSTNNPDLSKLAAAQLNNLLSSVEIVPLPELQTESE